MEKEFLSQEKYNELKTELDFLKKTKRKEVAEQLEYAKSLGDLSENAEYHEARDMQASVEDRINKLDAILKSASIVSTHSADIVTVGSTVVVERASDKKSITYTIVGSEEIDIANNKISNRSPFGEAIMGKKKGDTFSFKTPNGLISFKIVSLK
ncbi:MAG: transcription elongation factor GreA [Candidatus Paceibacterota bacterium]|jgi:transcription elongation factor GreA